MNELFLFGCYYLLLIMRRIFSFDSDMAYVERSVPKITVKVVLHNE